MKKLATAFAIVGLMAIASQANAHGRQHLHRVVHHYTHRHYVGSEGRPRAWCGWYMAYKLGIGGALGRSLWIAANWAYVGTPTTPHVGAIVVWAHHVGQIVGQQNGQWVVESGNDGNAVRSRPLSVRGATAFRDVSYGSAVADNDSNRPQTFNWFQPWGQPQGERMMHRRHYALRHFRHYASR